MLRVTSQGAALAGLLALGSSCCVCPRIPAAVTSEFFAPSPSKTAVPGEWGIAKTGQAGFLRSGQVSIETTGSPVWVAAPQFVAVRWQELESWTGATSAGKYVVGWRGDGMALAQVITVGLDLIEVLHAVHAQRTSLYDDFARLRNAGNSLRVVIATKLLIDVSSANAWPPDSSGRLVVEPSGTWLTIGGRRIRAFDGTGIMGVRVVELRWDSVTETYSATELRPEEVLGPRS